MSKVENRDQLIGLLSTTTGYELRHPEEAEEILRVLESAGLVIVSRSDLEEGIKKLESALREIRTIAHQAPRKSPDEEAIQYRNICTEALGDEETTRCQ